MIRIEKNFDTTKRNSTLTAKDAQELELFRKEKWERYLAEEPIILTIANTKISARPGLTFTPFANPIACNAHCSFCSEELTRDSLHIPTAKKLITDYDFYFSSLEKALLCLKGFPMGLSLSGLEATAEPIWLLRLLALIKKLEKEVLFNEKVLYTNGTGLQKFPYLLSTLKETGFDRVELSRCHFDQEINQKIMRFNKNEPIRLNSVYENTVKNLISLLDIKASCILNRQGIYTVTDLEQHLKWLESLGIKTVVFREMSKLENIYQQNKTSSWIEENRIEIDSLIYEIAPTLSSIKQGWAYLYSTFGYYYYNEHYLWNNSLEVIFETSSYQALIQANKTGIIQKMIFHSNGNLTGDWDSNSQVIANFGVSNAS
jgi:MoaA/NifB/PqqE/SkfB family radical SAM enzyme